MKLSIELSKWRCDRPDEWKMDEFIRNAEKLEAERYALATHVEHLKFVCKNMYEQYEWAMQTQMFNKTSAMAREIIDKPPHECLAAHDAEVAAKAVEDFCKSADGLAIEKCPQESDGCSEDLIVGWKAGNVDCRMAGFKYADQLRAKAGA